MGLVLVFIDGIGLGVDDADINPFVQAPMPNIRGLLDDRPLVGTGRMSAGKPLYATDRATLVPVDARLGVDGLPQSATGQTTLLTGINAPQALGRHVSGVPTPTLVRILRRHSIFKQLRSAGLAGTFANPFTEAYFEAVEAGRRRLSATTHALLSAQMAPRMLEDLLAGRAVFHDVTGETLREWGYDVPLISPEEAGRRLAALAADYEFTLFEYFLTDMAGHAQDMRWATRLLGELDRFVGSLVDHVDLRATSVLIISDHGNVEDLSVKTHTLNPVPALLIGAGKDCIATRLGSLTDVAPAVVDHLTRRRTGPSGNAPPPSATAIESGGDGCDRRT